ncbi:MAG: VPLPA-CTERM sorting domain-containing protein [Pseudomonadota bacterium]
MKHLLSALVLALTPVTAAAIPVQWEVSGSIFTGSMTGVFFNGPNEGPPVWFPDPTATVDVDGSFTYDADTDTYSDISVTLDYTVENNGVSGPVGPFDNVWDQAPFTMTMPGFGNAVTFSEITLAAAGGSTGNAFNLSFFTAAPLTNAGGTVTSALDYWAPAFFWAARGDVTLSGTPVDQLSSVPLPAGGLLLLGGLLGLGVLRRRC